MVTSTWLLSKKFAWFGESSLFNLMFFLVQQNQKVDYWWSNTHDLQSWVIFLQEGYCCFEKTDHLPSSEEEELKWQGTTQVLLAVDTTVP